MVDHYHYFMPAEWEPQEAVWLAWPHNPDTWYAGFSEADKSFAEITAELSREGTRVEILMADEATQRRAEPYIREAGAVLERVQFHQVPLNDSWIRDFGPTFVWEAQPNNDEAGEGEPHIVPLDWGFNAWGGKYPPWDDDNAATLRLAADRDWKVLQPGMVLEGGSIEVNGAGDLLTTRSCLLNKNRNPNMNQEQIEAELRRWLGVERIHWLSEGIAGDDTDGHIDDFARFVTPDTILACRTSPDIDPDNYEALELAHSELSNLRTVSGESFKIIELPMPNPVEFEGERLPVSYANFLISNGVVLVPVFNQPRDNEVLEIFSSIWPTRRIKGIYSTPLVVGLGAIHCLSQQQPVGKILKNTPD